MIKKILSSSLFKSSGIYTLSSLANAALPFLLLPFLTRQLTQAEYGIVSMFTLMQTFLVPLVSLNIQAAISRKYFSVDSKNEYAEYIGNALIILLTSTVFITILVFMLQSVLENMSDLIGIWLYMTIIVAMCQSLFVVTLTVFQVRNKSIQYGTVQVSQTFLNLVLTILLIQYLNMGLNGRLSAIVISYVLFFFICILILILNKDVILKFNLKYIKYILRLGIPVIPHAIGGIILGMADRFIIKNYISLEAAGVYTVAYQVGSLLNLFTASFNAAFIPWLFNKLKDNDPQEKSKIVKFTYLYGLGLIIITILLVIFLPIILQFVVGKEFDSAIEFLPFILLGFMFNGMYMMVANYIFYSEKTYFLAALTMSIVVLYIPLCIYLVKTDGAIGATYATAIAFLLLFIGAWVISSKLVKMPWFNFKTIKA